MNDPSRARRPSTGALRSILRPFMRVGIPVQAVFVDARFVRRQGVPASVGSRLLAFPALAWERLNYRARQERQDLLFARYTRLHRAHYGPSGRGYSTIGASSASDRMTRYRGQASRLEPFVDRYPELLRFRDGDSYLDLGCGTGQNIRMLCERYPSSRIAGYDLNANAVALIRECEPHPGLSVATGDLADADFRADALRGGVDHIVLSHVLAFIIAPSCRETMDARRRILSDLAAACRSSLIIIDTFGPSGDPVISIEQRQRANVRDDVLGYFSAIPAGRAYLVQAGPARAVVFVKDAPPQEGTT